MTDNTTADDGHDIDISEFAEELGSLISTAISDIEVAARRQPIPA